MGNETIPPVPARTWTFHPVGDALTAKTANGSPRWTMTFSTIVFTSVLFTGPPRVSAEFFRLRSAACSAVHRPAIARGRYRVLAAAPLDRRTRRAQRPTP